MLVDVSVVNDFEKDSFVLEAPKFFNNGETFEANGSTYRVLGSQGEVSNSDVRIYYEVEKVN